MSTQKKSTLQVWLALSSFTFETIPITQKAEVEEGQMFKQVFFVVVLLS